MGLYKLIKSALYGSRCKPSKLEKFPDFAFCLKERCDIGKYMVGTYYNGKEQKGYRMCRLFSKI